jgi:dTMP kinase
MAPRFITFEGLDGSGKSTHLRRAAERLRRSGLDPVVTHEPGGTELGERIRSIFLDPRWSRMDTTVEAMLVFASRRQHLLEIIRPALEAGRNVLCDRFTDSTVAYQGYGGGASLETLAAIERQATGGLQPDLTLLFDLPPNEARARRRNSSRKPSAVDSDRFDRERLAFYERVREGYLTLAAEHPERFRRVDASGSKEATAAQVKSILIEELGIAL